MSDYANKTKFCVISVFCRGVNVNEICAHLECYAAYNGSLLLTSFPRKYVGQIFIGQAAEGTIFII